MRAGCVGVGRASSGLAWVGRAEVGQARFGRARASWAGLGRRWVARPVGFCIGLLSTGKFVHNLVVRSSKKNVMSAFGIHLFFHLLTWCFHYVGFLLKCTIDVIFYRVFKKSTCSSSCLSWPQLVVRSGRSEVLKQN